MTVSLMKQVGTPAVDGVVLDWIERRLPRSAEAAL
jgi:hypothetical protein